MQPADRPFAIGDQKGSIHRPNAESSGVLEKARAAYQQGRRSEARTLTGQAIALDPRNADAHYLRAVIDADFHRHVDTVAGCDALLRVRPGLAEAYQIRATAHFFLGHIELAILDFDAAISIDRKRAQRNWQRGIACYYGGRFAEALEHFADRSVTDLTDAEFVFWHFAATARMSDVKAARERLLPSGGDVRAPMSELLSFYKGDAPVERVMSAAESQTHRSLRRSALFYARFYLGLFHDATGDTPGATGQIAAANDARIDGYLGDVAMVHAQLLRRRAAGL